ncbi:aminoglycoside phosphotransferase family protein [Brevibacterium album]|uniref:aminoglycoside phosphotransferase family protein n=1 Tax=Brevibacterium album TaxID=417948 RepID=UPI000400682F|nr:aminoglycoside phosphotransferase family protein [Brevibacterium album]
MKVPGVLYETASEVIGRHHAHAWTRALDFMLIELLDRWSLTSDPQPGSPWAGCESLVLPVRSAEGRPAVIRFAAPNTDNPGVHVQILEALRRWNGHGAVQVIADDPSFRATLQERLRTDMNLSALALDEVPPVWGQLARALRVPGIDGLVRVQDIAAGWFDRFAADTELLRDFPDFTQADWSLVNAARMWIEKLARHEDSWLLHADLHYYNILAGFPEPGGPATWKAIDPQPLTGPAEYMVAPLLWNRLAELPETRPQAQAAWLHAFAAEVCRQAGVDVALGVGAAVAREVENLFWYLRTARAGSQRAYGDARRSLWVARALSQVSVQGVSAHQLKPLG